MLEVKYVSGSFAEEKFLRMHLKGRPVLLYAKQSLEDYDVKAPQGPPDADLKLEWVYPFLKNLACWVKISADDIAPDKTLFSSKKY